MLIWVGGTRFLFLLRQNFLFYRFARKIFDIYHYSCWIFFIIKLFRCPLAWENVYCSLSLPQWICVQDYSYYHNKLLICSRISPFLDHKQRLYVLSYPDTFQRVWGPVICGELTIHRATHDRGTGSIVLNQISRHELGPFLEWGFYLSTFLFIETDSQVTQAGLKC